MYQKTASAQYNSIPMVTSLPSSADNGDEIVLTDSLSAGTYHWHLRYVAARSTNKWVFVGGSPAITSTTASEGTSSTAYTALTTAGPSFTIPVAGDYLVEIVAQVTQSSAAGAAYMSYAIGATAAADTEAAVVTQSSTYIGTITSKKNHSALAASTALVAKYRMSGGTGTFARRRMLVTPIALGG